MKGCDVFPFLRGGQDGNFRFGTRGLLAGVAGPAEQLAPHGEGGLPTSGRVGGVLLSLAIETPLAAAAAQGARGETTKTIPAPRLNAGATCGRSRGGSDSGTAARRACAGAAEQ